MTSFTKASYVSRSLHGLMLGFVTFNTNFKAVKGYRGLEWNGVSRHVRHGPVVISPASQVECSRCATTWPDLKLAAFFPSGPRWQIWLKHRANYYMPPTTTYMFTYACWEVRQLLAEGRRFPPGPPPIKLTRHDMTFDVESGVKHQSINHLATWKHLFALTLHCRILQRRIC